MYPYAPGIILSTHGTLEETTNIWPVKRTRTWSNGSMSSSELLYAYVCVCASVLYDFFLYPQQVRPLHEKQPSPGHWGAETLLPKPRRQILSRCLEVLNKWFDFDMSMEKMQNILPVQNFLSHLVVLESISYRTRATRLINKNNTTGGLQKIWTRSSVYIISQSIFIIILVL